MTITELISTLEIAFKQNNGNATIYIEDETGGYNSLGNLYFDSEGDLILTPSTEDY